MDADTAAAWEAHTVMLQGLAREGRLTAAMAADLLSEKGQQAWLRVYQVERARLRK